MSDRTGYTLAMVMGDLTEQQRQAIIDNVFDGYVDAADDERINVYEKSVGGVVNGECTSALQGLLDEWGLDRPWVMWEDPAYEWLGTVCDHVPGRADITGDCDAAGDMVIEAQAVEALLNDQSLGEAGLRAGLLALIGRAS